MSEEIQEKFVNITVKQDGYGYDTNMTPPEVSYWLGQLKLRVDLEGLGIKASE